MLADVARVDHNLQAIRAVESAWALPGLPDEVKLDLAGNAIMDPDGVAALLTGIEEDFGAAAAQRPLPTRNPLSFVPATPYPEPVQQSYGANTALTVASLTGVETVRTLDVDAVTRFKRRAVEEGFLDLDPEQVASPLWLPEYSRVAAQMSREDMMRRFAGERPGNLSLEKIGGIIEDWLSPRGLYRAAMELDLVWNFEQIGEEFETWGDKWRKLSEDFTFGNLVDALTGPIDDILFPIVNVGLMLFGVGQVAAVGRGLNLVRKAGGGATALQGLRQGAATADALADANRFWKTADALSDIERFQQSSWLSRKLMGSADDVGAIRSGLSKGMDAWRRQSGVVLAKKVNQQVMRQGFVSNVQSLMGANSEGRGVGELTGLDDVVNRAFENPVVDGVVDVLFTPPNIFKPGLVTSLGRSVTEQARRGFLKTAENRELTLAAHNAVEQMLKGPDGAGAAEVAAYRADVKRVGIQQAQANLFTGGDKETWGAYLGEASVFAAIQAEAAAMADLAGQFRPDIGDKRSLWLSSARQLHGKVRRLDPLDVNSFVDQVSAGEVDDAVVDLVESQLGRATPGDAHRQELVDLLRESSEEAAARGGAVPDGHRRFYGTYDVDTNSYTWSTTQVGDDPYFVDVADVELLRAVGGDPTDVERILRGDLPLPTVLTTRYLERTSDGITRHAKLSEAGKVRAFRQDQLEKMRGLVDHHNSLREATLKELLGKLDPATFQMYLVENAVDFSRGPVYHQAWGQLEAAEQAGMLENLVVSPALTESDRILSFKQLGGEAAKKWSSSVHRMVVDTFRASEEGMDLRKSLVQPLAKDLNVGGSGLALQRLDEPVAQEALAFYHEVTGLRRMLEGIRELKASEEGVSALTAALRGMDDARAGTFFPDDPVFGKRALRKILGGMAGQARHKVIQQIRRLGEFAVREGVSLDDIEQELVERLTRISQDARWSLRWRVPPVEEGGDIVETVKKQLKGLRHQTNFMAKAVDGVPEELEAQMAALGYKVVHGAGFLRPSDIADIVPEFADATARHAQRTALGSLLQRTDSEIVNKLKARKLRSELITQLGPDSGLHLGSLENPGSDLDQLVTDLWGILNEIQADQSAQLARAMEGGLLTRSLGRARASQTPLGIESLTSKVASGLTQKSFIKRLTDLGYTDDQAFKVWRAVKGSRDIGFKTYGLYNIEAKLRSSPNLVDALRGLGVQDAPAFSLQRTGRIATGAVAGTYAANLATDGDGLFSEDWDTTLLGAAGGALLGASRAGIPLARKVADGWENSKFVRYAYLGDSLADMRDYVRFTISPLFDLGRYAEAHVLNQIGEIPTVNGRKVNIPLNNSPSAYRRRIARKGLPDGSSVDPKTHWAVRKGQFNAAARKDFNAEVLDGVTQRFSAVGIAGFSPADWMSASFATLMDAGVDAKNAYNAVRATYTYGNQLRSAAEMSMNFVFFPFSFTKKLVGHLGSFFSDDLTRLVVLHDMFKSYEMVSEHYDLDQELRDRLPILELMRRANMLAYGIGPGQFGGVNAPILQGAGNLAELVTGQEPLAVIDPFMNAFVPQVVEVNDEESGDRLVDNVRRYLPIFNDITSMLRAAQSQASVVGGTWRTDEAENRLAWEEWRSFQEQVGSGLEQAGMTWGQALARPELNDLISRKRAEISARYPSWKQQIGDGIAASTAIDMELKERVYDPQGEPDRALVQFYQVYELTTAALQQAGFSWERPEEIPPETFDLLRRLGIQLSQETPGFQRLYDRFFRRQIGDIVTELY